MWGKKGCCYDDSGGSVKAGSLIVCGGRRDAAMVIVGM